MSMLKGDNDAGGGTTAFGGSSRNSATEGGRATYIAAGAKLKGEITSQNEIVIDGEIEGRLKVQGSVAVGAKGTVNGDIEARSVQVGGKVTGNVRCTDRFELQPSGRIEGDVAAPRIIISEGAFFKGNVEMGGAVGEHLGTAPAAGLSGS